MIHYLNISSEPCAQKYVIKTLPRTFYHCFSFVSTQIVQIKLKNRLEKLKNYNFELSDPFLSGPDLYLFTYFPWPSIF